MPERASQQAVPRAVRVDNSLMARELAKVVTARTGISSPAGPLLYSDGGEYYVNRALTPAQKAWAEKQSLADLTEYLEATNPLAVLKKQTDGKDGGNGLTQEELEMCKRMGVTPEDFAKAKGKC